MTKRSKDPDPAPLLSAPDADQFERFKALAKDEGLDTPEAQEAFKKALPKLAKGKPKGG